MPWSVGAEPALAIRLIVQRKPFEAAEATGSALRRSAAKKGKALDPRSLIAAEFMMLVTSLPRSGYSAPAVSRPPTAGAGALISTKLGTGNQEVGGIDLHRGILGGDISPVQIRAADRQAIVGQRGRATPTSGCDSVAQALESRAHQGSAAVAFVAEALIGHQRQAVLGEAGLQGGDLAVDGAVGGLLLGGDAGINGSAYRHHVSFFLGTRMVADVAWPGEPQVSG